MSKGAPIILIIIGLIILYSGGLTGRLGVVLAAIFTPESIDLTKDINGNEADQNDNVIEGSGNIAENLARNALAETLRLTMPGFGLLAGGIIDAG